MAQDPWQLRSVVPDFCDHETAYQHRSLDELRAMRMLLQVIQSSWLGRLGPKVLGKAFDMGLPVSGLVRKTMFKYFCGGETVEECQALMSKLSSHHVGSILDFAIEGGESEDVFQLVCEQVQETLTKNSKEQIAYGVFKPTAIASMRLLERVSKKEVLSQAELKEWEGVKNRVLSLCQKAYSENIPILIDAEESWINPAVDELAESMQKRFNRDRSIVFQTLQMYRTDRLEYMKKRIEICKNEGIIGGFKLVRGAYLEKENRRAECLKYPSPLHPSKVETDFAFDEAICLGLDNLAYCELFVGSHNKESLAKLCDLMAERGLSPSDSRICISQLLGMGDYLSFNLASHGFNVTKYVPYGPVSSAIPYLMRRAEENSSISGQAHFELNLIKSELKRRLQ